MHIRISRKAIFAPNQGLRMNIQKGQLLAALNWLKGISKRLLAWVKGRFVKAKSYEWYQKIAFYTGVVFVSIFLALFLIDINIFWLFGRSPKIADLKDPSMNVASELYSDSGKLIGKYFVENRTPVDYRDLPPSLIS